MDGSYLPVHHRGPRMAQRREERAHGIQLLRGQRTGAPLHAPYLAQPVIGREEGKRHAPARGQEPLLQERGHHKDCHGL